MSITYTWEITGLKTTSVGNTESVIVQTYWKKIGTDENGNTGSFNGATPFTTDSTDNVGPFIPFSELTEENVLDWIKSVVIGEYAKHIDEQILSQINDKINPIVESHLPWNKVGETSGPSI